MYKFEDNNARFAVKLTLLITSAMTMMAFAPLSAALPEIAREFSNNNKNIDFIIKLSFTIPSLAIIITSPFYGILIDYTGRKKILIFSLLLYGISGTIVIFITSIEQFIICRIISGIALSGIMTTSTTLVGDNFSGIHRQRFMSHRGAFVNYSAVILNLIGGVLATFNWRTVFIVFIVGLLMIPVTIKTIIYEKIESKRKLKNKLGTESRLPIVLIIFGLALNIIINSAFFMIPIQTPFLLKEINQFSPLLSGITTGTSAAAVATSSLFFLSLRKKIDANMIFVIGFFLVFLGFFSLSQINNLNFIYPCIVISGAGFGFIQANMFTWILDITPVEFRGRISGGIAMTTFGGQFLSPILSQPIIEIYGNQYSFLYSSLIMGFISIITFLFRKKI
ncbi:MAG: hypothetical protein CFH01_01147 [Alphaproteobacteria bacterium MarineAlpha2_Bin1]|nr:MAG: hypothetical protein CFH01_01147 [Alphaproteobacteria bacterium MarineAlpha2_Bin1]